MQKCMEIDLKNDRVLSVFLNLVSLLIAAAMLVPVCLNGSFALSKFYADILDGRVSAAQSLIQALAIIALVVCHEAIHGGFMKLFGAPRLNCGISIKNAYMGCDCFFSKNRYICITLAPCVILSGVLLTVFFCALKEWAWFVYLLLSLNIAGATGDIYVFRKVCGLPAGAMIMDTGLKAVAYIENADEEEGGFKHRLMKN